MISRSGVWVEPTGRGVGMILATLALMGGLDWGQAQVQWTEAFDTSPTQRGWRIWGEAGLFAWDAASEDLEVTWDSSKPNSFYARSLETVLTRSDDFELSFSLVLRDVVTGVSSNRPSTFQLAVGLMRLEDGLRTNFWRGSGFSALTGPRNTLEFDYFPDSDSGFGATISMALISSNNQFADFGHMMNFPLALELGVRHEVKLVHTASNQVLRTTVLAAGQSLGPIKDLAYGGTAFSDFRFDHVAIMSFSDAGQDPNYGGSILAHGTVDDVVVRVPGAPVGAMRALVGQGRRGVTFASLVHWDYVLERAAALGEWRSVAGSAMPGTGAELSLEDPEPAEGTVLYRVRAQR